MSRYLGIDFGEKRIGVAISDPSRTIAQPLKTITYTHMDAAIHEIDALVQEYAVVKIVVGLPVTLKGTDSRKTTEVREFIQQLQQVVSVPVEAFDERLTTLQAHRSLHQMGKKPSRERKRVDQLAAVHLLQNFLDREINQRTRS
ncbi:MAG: Holliday junction resolvase RuvX [Calditrichaeota bacterium]|nr:Holliday junction resolvase RuvX [Calditrichota bacterium]